MEYYRRHRQDGTPFYINEDGAVVDEATAKTNLVETSSARRRQLIEGASPRKMKSLEQQLQERDAEIDRLRAGQPDRLLDSCNAISASPKEAELLAKLLREA